LIVRLAWFVAAATLAVSPDVSGVLQLQPPQQNQQTLPKDQNQQDQNVPVLPNFDPPSDGASQRDAAQPDATQPDASQPDPTQSAAQSNEPLKEESRMDILRSVDGEFARLLTSLPGGRKGFHVRAGEAIDQNALRGAIRASGAALNTGDNVQITRLDFQGHAIQIDLNGGGRKQGSWKDHVQMQVGVPTPVQTTSSTSNPNGPVITSAKKTGAPLYLDFDRDLPNMSADQVKQYLAAVLDFSKQRSAAVQWTDTLPPKIQVAIAEKRPEVGMDRDEVLAAIGRPERKVRERQVDGAETEDWIYGRPPAKTIFVRFTADKVTQIDSYPD
jgi:hypothetical protein